MGVDAEAGLALAGTTVFFKEPACGWAEMLTNRPQFTCALAFPGSRKLGSLQLQSTGHIVGGDCPVRGHGVQHAGRAHRASSGGGRGQQPRSCPAGLPQRGGAAEYGVCPGGDSGGTQAASLRRGRRNRGLLGSLCHANVMRSASDARHFIPDIWQSSCSILALCSDADRWLCKLAPIIAVGVLVPGCW